MRQAGTTHAHSFMRGDEFDGHADSLFYLPLDTVIEERPKRHCWHSFGAGVEETRTQARRAHETTNLDKSHEGFSKVACGQRESVEVERNTNAATKSAETASVSSFTWLVLVHCPAIKAGVKSRKSCQGMASNRGGLLKAWRQIVGAHHLEYRTSRPSP